MYYCIYTFVVLSTFLVGNQFFDSDGDLVVFFLTGNSSYYSYLNLKSLARWQGRCISNVLVTSLRIFACNVKRLLAK